MFQITRQEALALSLLVLAGACALVLAVVLA